MVISRAPESLEVPAGVVKASSPQEAVALASASATPGQRVWVIGGAEIYRETLALCDEVHLTVVEGEHEGDAWLPPFEDLFTLQHERQGSGCTFKVFVRR